MKKIIIFLALASGLTSYEESHEEFMERMVYTHMKVAQEIRESRDPLPSSSEEFVAQQARLGRCFKGHQGIYLDTTFYESGVWLCRERWNGETCPWSIDRHYPNGIPR